MSRRVPHCLKRLALGLDADTVTIRRAYARELNLIDQEQDLAGFQVLRQAYEAALEWGQAQAGGARARDAAAAARLRVIVQAAGGDAGACAGTAASASTRARGPRTGQPGEETATGPGTGAGGSRHPTC